MRPAFLTLAPIMLLGACGQSADTDAVLETVRATEQAQFEAIAAKDLRGATRNYEDAAILVAHGRAPTVGAAAIGTTYEALLADPNLKIEITPGQAWAASSGDMVVTTHTARVTTTDPATGKPATAATTNQTVWRKEAGDPWKIAADYQMPLTEASPANEAT